MHSRLTNQICNMVFKDRWPLAARCCHSRQDSKYSICSCRMGSSTHVDIGLRIMQSQRLWTEFSIYISTAFLVYWSYAYQVFRLWTTQKTRRSNLFSLQRCLEGLEHKDFEIKPPQRIETTKMARVGGVLWPTVRLAFRPRSFVRAERRYCSALPRRGNTLNKAADDFVFRAKSKNGLKVFASSNRK